MTPDSLELFAWHPAADEYHFYLQGLSPADVTALFAPELAKARCLVVSYDPAVLAPEHWEAYSRDVEDELRQKLGGVVTRLVDGARQIWRADRASEKLLRGRVLALPGSQLGRFNGTDALVEWAAFAGAEGDAARAQADIDAFRLRGSGATMLFSADGAHSTRLAFRSAEPFRRALNAALRGFAAARGTAHSADVSHRVIDTFAAVIDGVGLKVEGDGGFVDKGRTFEIVGRLGRTRWGVRRAEALDAIGDDGLMLIYYDRVSGIWQVVA